jgi:hypothetical protein
MRASLPEVGAKDALPIAFVHIQETAGTSFRFVLRNSFGLRHSDVNPLDPSPGKPFDRHDLRFVRSSNPQVASISDHELIEPTRYLAGLVSPYTMLRDPVDRALSHYQYQVATGRQSGDFARYVDDPANHNFQVRKIAGTEDVEKAIFLLREAFFFVGLTERFDESVRLFSHLCPHPVDSRCRRLNTATRDDIRRELEAEGAAMSRLREAKQLDRQLWEYVDRALSPVMPGHAGGGAPAGTLPQYPGAKIPWRFQSSRLRKRIVYRTRLKRPRSLHRSQA